MILAFTRGIVISARTYLGNHKQPAGVSQLPVSKLVGENSNDLLSLALLNQSIEQDDMFLPGHSKEISIAVGASLAAIDDVELVQGELELSSQGLDTGLQLTLLQGRELVKQGQDGNRVDGNHEHLQTSRKHPEVEEELVTSLLDDSEESRQNRRDESDSQEVGLDQIGNKQLGGLFVEPEFLFQNEVVVDVGRERENLLDDDEGQDKDNRM